MVCALSDQIAAGQCDGTGDGPGAGQRAQRDDLRHSAPDQVRLRPGGVRATARLLAEPAAGGATAFVVLLLVQRQDGRLHFVQGLVAVLPRVLPHPQQEEHPSRL